MSDGKRQDSVCEEPSPKKLKIYDDKSVNFDDKDPLIRRFIPEKILVNNTARKTVTLQGKLHGKSGVAIVLLEKRPFDSEEDIELFKDKLYSLESQWKLTLDNDIYSVAESTHSKFGNYRSTLTFPATDRHIRQFSQQNFHLVPETPESYDKLTLPFLQKEQFKIDWVYNILDGLKEVDRVVYNDPDPETGFVLVPDLKWDGKPETLYLLGVIRKRGIKSLRDLDGSHLPLLLKLLHGGKKAISDKYTIPSTRVRAHIHYQPSFYHLHIHYTSLQYDAPGINVERSHLLDTVINNIQIMPDYYKKATIPFLVREMDNLFNVYETAGYVAKIKPTNDVETELIVK